MKIPLHGKGTKSEILDLHVYMAQINPSGFRQASSKKNRRRPKTRVERLAKEVYGK